MDREVDVAIVGAGTAGMRAYREARAHGARTVLIEGRSYGTTCARVGCMPSKLLIAAADAAWHAEHAWRFGSDIQRSPLVNGPAVLARVRAERDRFVGFVQRDVEGFDPRDRLWGEAHFVAPGVLDVAGHRVLARSVVVATGSKPRSLPFLDTLGDRVLTTDEVFDLPDLPSSLLVFGPGVIGLELGQALARLGVRVRILGVGGLIGPLTDPEIRAEAAGLFAPEVGLDADAQVVSLTRTESGVRLVRRVDGALVEEDFDLVLSAVGRVPDLSSLRAEAAGLELDGRGFPQVDQATLSWSGQPVFVAGDALGDRPLLHEASDEGTIAGRNAVRYPTLDRLERRAALGITFTDPNLLTVGASYRELANRPIVLGRVSFADQGRSRVMLQNRGRLHIYADADTGALLGAEGVAPRGEHLAHLLAWAIQLGVTVEQALTLPFYHPVIEEGLRTALRDAASSRTLRAAS